MKKTVLRQYAKLIATVGGNVQPGQEVLIYAGLDQPEFVAMLVEECYRAGAKKVNVDWSYSPLTKLHAKYQRQDVLSTVEEWEKAKLAHMVDTLPVRISLSSSDPDALKGIRQPRYSNAMRARTKVTRPYRMAIDNKHQWCIAAVPGEAWAKKVFPDLPKRKAVEKLWEAILDASRANGDAVKNWNDHNAQLQKRCDYLNSKKIVRLNYKADNGTDFTVGLLENAKFLAGGERTMQGVYYNPNIPTEEVFTTPRKGDADGIVYSTKPLSYMGQLIEDFSVRFEGGKAVEVKAAKNEELLKAMISMDENAGFLGECALVPVQSPINQSGILYYNTLFDENAACHLALGYGFAECIIDYPKYTQQELEEMGVNNSSIHVDFMIGCDTMDITGICADGSELPIFRGGEWAF